MRVFDLESGAKQKGESASGQEGLQRYFLERFGSKGVGRLGFLLTPLRASSSEIPEGIRSGQKAHSVPYSDGIMPLTVREVPIAGFGERLPFAGAVRPALCGKP